jgi:hypothetical protein
MPIDGDVWLEDPLHSSYPPSIAFKAAQLQDPKKALAFLRRIREMVFLEKKNITKWEHLQAAAVECGLNPLQLRSDYENFGKQHFEEFVASFIFLNFQFCNKSKQSAVVSSLNFLGGGSSIFWVNELKSLNQTQLSASNQRWRPSSNQKVIFLRNESRYISDWSSSR